MTNLNKTDINDKVKTDIIERSGFLKDYLKRVCAGRRFHFRTPVI